MNHPRLSRSAVVFLAAFMLAAGCSQQYGGGGDYNNTIAGTLAGAGLGAGAGAIIGNQAHHHAGAGVAIGSGLGAVGGALIGAGLDNQQHQINADRERLDRQQAQIDENRRLIEELRSRGTDVRESSRGVVINLPDILFDFDKATLTHDAQGTVREIADVLKNRGVNRRLAVEGHTDSIGTVMYNKRLSTARAESVARELSGHGIPHSRMQVVGLGEGSPIATNNTDEGRARNRRVEIIVQN